MPIPPQFNLLRNGSVAAWNEWRDAEDANSRPDLNGVDLTGVDLTGVDLTGVNLSGARLTRANLSDARLYRANLTDADLTDADLIRANLIRANLTGADLTRANLADAHLSGADLSGANLTDARLFRANLTGASLTGGNLTGANLTRGNLLGANLTRGNLLGANLTNARLTGANLTNARLTGANLTNADLTRADLDGTVVTLPDLVVASSLVGASLGLNLSSGQESAEPALPESAVGMVTIETPVDAEESPETVLELVGAVEALSRLAVVVGVSSGWSNFEGGSSVAVMSTDEVRITLSRLSYGSPLIATLVEYWYAAAAGSGGVAWAVRDVLKGEHSRLYNLLALLTRPSERQSVNTKRDLHHQVDIARLEREIAEATGQEPVSTSTTIESQWTIEPSSRNDFLQRIEIDQTIDPIARAEMIRALNELAPLIERGFSVTITEPVLDPDAETPQQ